MPCTSYCKHSVSGDDPHEHNNQTEHAVKAALVAVAACLAAALVALGVLTHSAIDQQNHTISGLQAKVTAQRAEVTAQRAELKTIDSSVATLLANSGSQPTDPLSAYTDICNTQDTNDATGVTQTYYYPCTNNATTIPQPGN
jgi:hypothetical protein